MSNEAEARKLVARRGFLKGAATGAAAGAASMAAAIPGLAEARTQAEKTGPGPAAPAPCLRPTRRAWPARPRRTRLLRRPSWWFGRFGPDGRDPEADGRRVRDLQQRLLLRGPAGVDRQLRFPRPM
ncbi:MAG: twin-arginine translocation signal domain-containing protein [Caulobacteraceae bacterium]